MFSFLGIMLEGCASYPSCRTANLCSGFLLSIRVTHTDICSWTVHNMQYNTYSVEPWLVVGFFFLSHFKTIFLKGNNSLLQSSIYFLVWALFYHLQLTAVYSFTAFLQQSSLKLWNSKSKPEKGLTVFSWQINNWERLTIWFNLSILFTCHSLFTPWTVIFSHRRDTL